MQESDLSEPSSSEEDSLLGKASQIWRDPHHVEFSIRTEDKPRCIAVGKACDGSYITAAYASERGDSRLLSARSSLPQEASYLNPTPTQHPSLLEIKRVNVDFPHWMVKALDREAGRIGVPRQAIVKTWLAQYLSAKGLSPNQTNNSEYFQR